MGASGQGGEREGSGEAYAQGIDRMRPLVKRAAYTVGGMCKCRSGAGSRAGSGVGGTMMPALSEEGGGGIERASVRASAGETLHAAATESLFSCADVVLLALVTLELAARCCAASRCPDCVSAGVVLCGMERTARTLC